MLKANEMTVIFHAPKNRTVYICSDIHTISFNQLIDNSKIEQISFYQTKQQKDSFLYLSVGTLICKLRNNPEFIVLKNFNYMLINHELLKNQIKYNLNLFKQLNDLKKIIISSNLSLPKFKMLLNHISRVGGNIDFPTYLENGYNPRLKELEMLSPYLKIRKISQEIYG